MKKIFSLIFILFAFSAIGAGEPIQRNELSTNSNPAVKFGRFTVTGTNQATFFTGGGGNLTNLVLLPISGDIMAAEFRGPNASLYITISGQVIELSTSPEEGDKTKFRIDTLGNARMTDDLDNAFVIEDGLDPLIKTGFTPGDGVLRVDGGIGITNSATVHGKIFMKTNAAMPTAGLLLNNNGSLTISNAVLYYSFVTNGVIQHRAIAGPGI